MAKSKVAVQSKVAQAARLLISIGVFAATLSANAQLVVGSAPASLEKIQSMRVTPLGEIEIKLNEERDLRAKAMREGAHSYGARSGLIRRTYDIRQTLDRNSTQLDAVANFAPLMLTDMQVGEVADGRARLIVPPVIVSAKSLFNQTSDSDIRLRSQTYRIESNARFSAVPMNWRNYLVRNLGEQVPALPHQSLMPRTPEEKTNWNIWVAEGWTAGVRQAEAIFDSDLNRLARDLDGMVRYFELVDQKVVTLPYVATRNDGVTGDANQINVNDVTLRISIAPAFRLDSKSWEPTATK